MKDQLCNSQILKKRRDFNGEKAVFGKGKNLLPYGEIPRQRKEKEKNLKKNMGKISGDSRFFHIFSKKNLTA